MPKDKGGPDMLNDRGVSNAQGQREDKPKDRHTQDQRGRPISRTVGSNMLKDREISRDRGNSGIIKDRESDMSKDRRK